MDSAERGKGRIPLRLNRPGAPPLQECVSRYWMGLCPIRLRNTRSKYVTLPYPTAAETCATLPDVSASSFSAAMTRLSLIYSLMVRPVTSLNI